MVAPALITSSGAGDALRIASGERAAPLVAQSPGFAQALATADTDVPVAIPAGAVRVTVWFATSAADDTQVAGRVGFGDSNAVALSATNLGYQPAHAETYDIVAGVTHLHVAASLAGAVAKGTFVFSS